ncbi:MAG: NusG domain II-containing protein [Candidatus Fimadaptatus sp.]
MKVGDWVLIACALALSAALAVWVWLPAREDAGMANVYVDGELRAALPLDEDAVFTVSEDGAENVIEVKGGRARMLSANCPDGYCVRQGEVRYDGETVICLPHRVVIELSAGEESGLDAIAG